jgi:tetratricopeptide (TPR) repeat protein
MGGDATHCGSALAREILFGRGNVALRSAAGLTKTLRARARSHMSFVRFMLLVFALALFGGCAVNTTSSDQTAVSNVGSLIHSLWDFNDRAASEQRFREALKSASGDDALELETQIARTFSLRRDFVQANAILDGVQSRIAVSSRPAVRVRYLLERGRSLNSAGQFDAAKPLFQEAYDIALKEPALIGLAIDAAHMFGFSKDKDEAFRWTELGMKLAMASDHPDALGWRPGLANNLGSTERERGNLDAAMAHFQVALAEHLARSKPPQIRIAYWQVANVHRLQSHTDEAVAIQLRLEKEADQAKSPDVYIYSELAQLFSTPTHAKRDLAEAKRYALLALALAEKDTWMVKNEAELIAKLRGIQGQ